MNVKPESAIDIFEGKGEILVMGVGNYLMGDEGIGVHVVQHMEKMDLPDYLDVLDGGTGGFLLMNYFDEYPNIIFVDATMDGKPAGSVSVLEPRFASDFPNALSVHDVGLKDMIEAVYLMEKVPKMYLITISIDEIRPMTLELDNAVNKAIPKVVDQIMAITKNIITPF